jgi:hypothetical protein
MDVKLYTGNGSTQTISGLNFSPDLVWVKARSSVISHFLHDVVRGTGQTLFSNLTVADQTNYAYGYLSAFTSDGFTVQGGSLGNDISANSATYAAWCWDAGTSTVTDNSGSIQSTRRTNASSGFSVVTYTGNGTNNATVGHGLGVAPTFLMCKSRSAGGNWQVWGANMNNGSFDCIMNLNTTGPLYTSITTRFRAASSTTFTIGTDNDINGSGTTYVVYAFSPVSGYSSLSSYVPAMDPQMGRLFIPGLGRSIYLKSSTSVIDWIVEDAC